MSDPEGSRVTHCGKIDPTRDAPGPPVLQRASSVPEGHRPVLIIEPESSPRQRPRLGRPRRDPLLDPEVVAARVRAETLKEIGRRIQPITEGIAESLARVREQLSGVAPRSRKDRFAGLQQALAELDRAERNLHYLAAKAAQGMAETLLPPLIRDAVKRSFPGTVGVGFRLPDMREKASVAVHPQHLLEALTLAVSMVLTRIASRGELQVTLSRGSFFQEILVTGVPADGGGLGELPRPEDAARLRHLIGSLHQGTVRSSLGERGAVQIALALPLRRMEAEARP